MNRVGTKWHNHNTPVIVLFMTNESEAVKGLYDTKGVARKLGVKPGTVRAWIMRGKEDPSESPLGQPVGTLNGNVWTEAQVRKAEASLAKSPRKAGRPRKDPS